jgi:phospholipid transport system substrate-binding protein
MRPLITLYALILSLLLLNAFPSSPGAAESPMDKIKQATVNITKILDDFVKDPNTKRSEAIKEIMAIADTYFDWEEMAKRSLARYWKERTGEEQKEFVPLFRDLLKNAYIGRIESYSGEQVVFIGEMTEDSYAEVKSKVVSPAKRLEVPINYRLLKKGADWLVYDIVIEGVSLVNNYREQFNTIIQSSSYADLVKKIKEKVAQKPS